MEQKIFMKRSIALLLGLFLAFLITSCSDDDDSGTTPDPDAPTLALEGNSERIVKNGETISLTFSLNAPGGAKELVVYRGGGFLESVPLASNATTYTYTNQSVPAEALEGDLFEYEFILADLNDNDSQPVEAVISTRVYDEITIGGQLLYNVNIYPDEVVPNGSTVRFITGRNYYIPNTLDFDSGTTYTIQEGVTVYVNANAEVPIEIRASDGVAVSITGTSDNPVVFTSSAVLEGTPQPGDWNRIRFGSIENGTIQYVRSEYAIEGFRFAGTSGNNTLHHLSAFHALEEGFYITDGNSDFKYLVSVDSGSGGFRLGDAYAGKIQFGISQISQTINENQELDIRETASPVISNFTIIGPGPDADNTHGVRLRGNSSGKIYNSIVASLPRRAVRLNDNVVVTDFNGPTVFAYSYVFDVGSQAFRDDTDNGNPFQGYINDDGELVNPFHNNITGFNGSNPVLAGIEGINQGSFIPNQTVTAQNSFNPNSINSFFTSVTYVGAIENANGDWTKGWVKNPDGSIR